MMFSSLMIKTIPTVGILTNIIRVANGATDSCNETAVRLQQRVLPVVRDKFNTSLATIRRLGESARKLRENPNNEIFRTQWAKIQEPSFRWAHQHLTRVDDVIGSGANFRHLIYRIPLPIDPNLKRAELYTSPRPGYSNGDVETSIEQYTDSVKALGENAPQIAYDLAEPSERKPGELEQMYTIFKEVREFPIKDFTVPKPCDFVELICSIVNDLQHGHKVIIFCKAGEGRTGMVLAGVMHWLESECKRLGHITPLIDRLRRVNPHYVEKWKQFKFLEMFANALKITRSVGVTDPKEKRSFVIKSLNAWSILYLSESTKQLVLSMTENECQLTRMVDEEPTSEQEKDLHEAFMNAGCIPGTSYGSYTSACQSIMKCLGASEKILAEVEDPIKIQAALFGAWYARTKNPHFGEIRSKCWEPWYSNHHTDNLEEIREGGKRSASQQGLSWKDLKQQHKALMDDATPDSSPEEEESDSVPMSEPEDEDEGSSSAAPDNKMFQDSTSDSSASGSKSETPSGGTCDTSPSELSLTVKSGSSESAGVTELTFSLPE